MSVNAGNPLSATSLNTLMIHSLSKSQGPQLRNPYDAAALLIHSCMLAVGFKLIGLGEDHKIEVKLEAESVLPLPIEWNSTKTSDYAFRYTHNQSSLQYLVKVSRLGSKAVVNGLAIGDDKVHSFDFQVKDFLSESSFPYTTPVESPKDQAPAALSRVFISEGRVTDLASLMKLRVVQKLAPGLRKEGYEDSAHAASPTSRTQQQPRQPAPGRERDEPTHDPLRDDRLPPYAQPRPFDDPLAAAPRRPYPLGDFPPPGFEDEYEINRPPRGGPYGGERRPLNIGERDLYPQGLGPHDPLRAGGFGPSGGIGGGGMHPTFDDPLFGGPGGYDGRAPPGARYDPIGPGDGPSNLRGGPRFPGGGGGLGGFGGSNQNPFGGLGGNDFI